MIFDRGSAGFNIGWGAREVRTLTNHWQLIMDYPKTTTLPSAIFLRFSRRTQWSFYNQYEISRNQFKKFFRRRYDQNFLLSYQFKFTCYPLFKYISMASSLPNCKSIFHLWKKWWFFLLAIQVLLLDNFLTQKIVKGFHFDAFYWHIFK